MEISRTASAVDTLIAERAASRPEATGRPAGSEDPALAAQQQQPASKEQVEQAVKDIRKVVNSVASDLQFSVDKDSGKTVVKIVDAKTREVIRQIPGEEVLALRRALDKMKGMLFSMEA